jgi:hypothetical protein
MREFMVRFFVAASILFAASTSAVHASIYAVEECFVGSVDLNGTAVGLDVVFNGDQEILGINVNEVGSPDPYYGYGTISVAMGTLHLTTQSDGSLTGTLDRYITDGGNSVHQSIDVIAETMGFTIDGVNLDLLVISGAVTSVTQSDSSAGTYDWSGVSLFSWATTVIAVSIGDIVGVDGAQIDSAEGCGDLVSQ